jgi:hypothetical protein
MRLLAVAVVVACLTGACSGESGDSTSPTTTVAPSASVPGGPVPDGACAAFRGATGSLSSTGARPESLLVAADAEILDCLDKVTFTFVSLGNGLPPGYTVAYRDVAAEPLKDGDTEISVPGDAFLVVTMKPALSTDPRLEGNPPTYRGNLRLAYERAHHLQSVQKLPDLDGSVQWVIGLDGTRPFLVDSTMNPPRVSVYIG